MQGRSTCTEGWSAARRIPESDWSKNPNAR